MDVVLSYIDVVVVVTILVKTRDFTSGSYVTGHGVSDYCATYWDVFSYDFC